MSLVERLERRAKELDRDLAVGIYNAQKYDDREMLEAAADALRGQERYRRDLAVRTDKLLRGIDKLSESNECIGRTLRG